MHIRRITLTSLAAACLATAVGCSSTPSTGAAANPVIQRDATAATPEQPGTWGASMIATDEIGAAIFAGDFRPYAGRIDGPAQATFATEAETAFAGVRTD